MSPLLKVGLLPGTGRGDNSTSTMVLTNNRPDMAAGMTIVDPMPAGNALASTTASLGSCVTAPSTLGPQTNVSVVADRRNKSATARVAGDQLS